MRKIGFFLILVLLMASTASAATFTVGPTEQYKTIQDAVDAAADRDIINVASGTYKEYVTFTNKNLNIVGQKFPTVEGFAPGSSAMDIDGFTSISGFTIKDKGVSLSGNGGIVIKNNKFNKCGLYVSGSSYNVITKNKFSGSDTEIFLYQSYDNEITGNTIDRANTGLLVKGDSTCTKISGNTFQNCKVGVQIPSIPSYLIGNTYKKNKVNIKLA